MCQFVYVVPVTHLFLLDEPPDGFANQIPDPFGRNPTNSQPPSPSLGPATPPPLEAWPSNVKLLHLQESGNNICIMPSYSPKVCRLGGSVHGSTHTHPTPHPNVRTRTPQCTEDIKGGNLTQSLGPGCEPEPVSKGGCDMLACLLFA